jgi:hypothetical protein
MITYQVDQCANSREFAEACNRQGLVELWRFPHRLQGQKDPDVLAEVLPSGRTLLTTDREIHTNHLAYIPEMHSGILIVANAPCARSITKRDLMRILSAFKSQFHDWHRLSLRNLIVEITESSVEIWKVVRGTLQRLDFIPFSQPEWQARLLALIGRDSEGASISDST